MGKAPLREGPSHLSEGPSRPAVAAPSRRRQRSVTMGVLWSSFNKLIGWKEVRILIRPGQRREDHHPLSPQRGGGGPGHRANRGVQCGDGAVQKYKAASVGPRWTVLHQAVLEMLLCGHK